MSPPAVSVCIPAYEAETYVADCIASVLAQTCTDWELIVIDDCSSDATFEVASAAVGDRGVVVRNDTNLGPTGNWNAVVARATGRAIKVLCSDDLLRPSCLQHELDALDANPSVGFVGAKRDIIDADGQVVLGRYGLAGMSGLVPRRDAMRKMVRAANTPWGEPSIVLFRAEALRQAGPFRDTFGTLTDVDMYARVLADWDAFALDETVGAFRVSAASWSNRSHRVQAGNARRLLRAIAADPRHDIGRRVLAEGLVRSEIISRLRKTAFALAGRRARRRARGAA
jgi:glycosyltransferase involved in cell wall biosynthesis